jgi:AraC-like DNA-binding protein
MLCRNFYTPMCLDVHPGDTPFLFSFTVMQFGPVTVGEVEYSSDIRASCGDLVTAYNINVPLTGHHISTHRGREVAAHPGLAAVYQPVGDCSVRHWSGHSRQLAIKIDRYALENHLESYLDRSIRGYLDLAASADLSTGAGRGWARLVRTLADEMKRPDSLAHQLLFTELIADSVMTGLLLAVRHPYRDELTDPRIRARPRTIQRAIDAIQADPAHPFGAIELARTAGVSVRTLQVAFRRYTGTTPMAYLRQIRLTRAHDELRRADPSFETVAEVAYRCGFTHLGRFAATYRDRYGVTPSTTLHEF